MKIGIDARVMERKISGIGRYLSGFLEYLSRVDKKNQYFLFCYEDLPEFREMNYKIIATGKSKILPAKVYNLYWLFFILPKILKKYKIDVFFNPNHYLPVKTVSSKEIIAIHDLSHKVEKSYKSFIYKFFYLDYLLPRSAKKADIILTVSENSKKDILKYHSGCFTNAQSRGRKKIKVIYEGADRKFRPRSLSELKFADIKKKYFLPEKFVLYVGRIEERKNIKGIIKIAKIFESRFLEKNLKFVLIGESGYSGFKNLFEEIRKQKNICHIEHIKDDDLPYIYNSAKIFLFPSFYEGFGLPVLEAMQSGVPVLTSNTSSLPEVVGDGGIMHSPNDYEGFAGDIARLLEDKSFYKKMSEKAVSRAEKFSWQESAKQLAEIFNHL